MLRFLKSAIHKHKIREGKICYEGWEGHYTTDTDRVLLGRIATSCDVRLHKANKVLQIYYDLLRNNCDSRQTYTQDSEGRLHPTSLSIRIA